MLYDIIKPQSDAGFGVLNSNPLPQAGSGSGTTYVERELDSAEDTVPPFWPTLATDDGGETFTFTITDGYVFERTHAPWLPTGLSTEVSPASLSTERPRVQIAIDAAKPQISIVVATDPDGVVTFVTYNVEAEDTASIEPDGDAVNGELHYKLAVFRAATDQLPAYLEMVMAGSHIFYERGGAGGAGDGLTGYVRFVKQNLSYSSTSILYVRYESGRMTAIQDDYISGAVPVEWGSVLYEVYFVMPAGYGASNIPW
jgi:hypothetical protein